MSTQYDHLATVGPEEDGDRDQWSTDSWANVFPGEGSKYNDGDLTWHAATRPPKAEVEPLTPDDVVEVTHIWAESWREYSDQQINAVMRLDGGRWACLESWSDSSGYGCRDGTAWHVGDTFEDIVRWGLSDEARGHLGLDQPGGGEAQVTEGDGS